MKKLNTLSIIGIAATAAGAVTAAAIVGTKMVMKKMAKKAEEKQEILRLNAPQGVGDDAQAELDASQLKDEDRAKQKTEFPRVHLEDKSKKLETDE
ncbi:MULTISPECIES: hypothetical protein [Lactobacillus]|uniref:Uncharacterized protein n=1 Tax=Lactobacillus xujianguonis TaxID=2495899 RepID=A0A437SWA0_9LACO|nr:MULTISPECIES: hypothetical protein [Lactobacillus]RVU71130.1 hypothetical protein EJK17_03765 [Lactobacillus xujianguonis]RVU77477.1 hypothetical protein EJK20_01590 [Lactobacillus xujianguonis]